MANPNVVAFKKTVLTAPHVTTYNNLSGAGKSSAALAAAEGIDSATAVKKLTLLVDEGLAAQDRVGGTPNGATLDSYHLS